LSVLARTIHADLSPLRRLKKTLQFCFNGFRHKQEFLALQDVFDSPELKEVKQLCPAILEKSFKPYVRIDWDCAQRHEKIGHHFLFLKELFGECAAEIYKPEGYTLFEFSDVENERYSVELFPGYQNEGSIGIRLCDSQRREIYTVSLHLSSAEENACYIGALQGPNDRIPERQKAIVSLTRSLHGLRPKALMLEALYMVVDTLGIDQMYGISNAGHIYNASVYSKEKRNAVHFDRDQMWKEYRAERISECLFQFPTRPVRKDIASLKPNKRSMYRKRYAWLSQVAYEADDALNALRVLPVKKAVLYDINKVA
jgi:uncharacterized protein VirK/YbjX